MVYSPITKSSNVNFLLSIDKEHIVQLYAKHFKIDISVFFKNIDQIFIYECVETGYRFFYPFTISGDEQFYKNLEVFPWYYDPWKWEHQKALKWTKPTDKVLEIGCGKGSFIKYLKESFKIDATGLELNKNLNPDLHILHETIETHALKYSNCYDIVCSFQVLEHICDVKNFILSSSKCLKDGGLMIVSVPNNDSFIQSDFPNDILNLPPHHMGWWNEASLIKSLQLFSFEKVDTFFEPLRDQHISWYLNVYEQKLKKFSQKSWKMSRLFKLKGILKRVLKFTPLKPKGHTILMVFKKI